MDNPVVLKEEIKGMRYTYCKSKAWSRREQIEKICWTKKIEKSQKAEAKKSKNSKPDQVEEIVISITRIKGARGLEKQY